jgi:XTP/dITP diphosphohydrolase
VSCPRAPGAARSVRACLASGNPHKLGELRRTLPGWEISACLGSPQAAPAETGSTFLENARLKARYGREHAPAEVWALGEDSGIEVAALGGRPGIESARWAEDGVARLLAELAGVSARRARYVCELVAIASNGRELHGTGTLEGTIADVPRGEEGFGYDPIFVPLGETRTVAELGDAWKACNSHRARAAATLAQALAG